MLPAKNSAEPAGSILVEQLAIRIVRPAADVVQLEIGVQRHHDDAVHGLQPRLRQIVAGQINGKHRRLAELQISRRIVRDWVRYRSSLRLSKRKRGNVARCTADLPKQFFAFRRCLSGTRGRCGIDLRGNWKRRLEERAGRDVGASQFVHNAVAVRIGADAEALGGLHPVMLVESVDR